MVLIDFRWLLIIAAVAVGVAVAALAVWCGGRLDAGTTADASGSDATAGAPSE